MDIVKIALLMLVVLVLCGSIPTFSKEITILITFSCCIVVLLYAIEIVTPAIEYIKNIAKQLMLSGFEVVIKTVGVGFITQFVSDMALDCNNRALSNQMIFAGRVCIIVLAMPLVIQIFEIIERLTVI